jgi:hypothetical protein
VFEHLVCQCPIPTISYLPDRFTAIIITLPMSGLSYQTMKTEFLHIQMVQNSMATFITQCSFSTIIR